MKAKEIVKFQKLIAYRDHKLPNQEQLKKNSKQSFQLLTFMYLIKLTTKKMVDQELQLRLCFSTQVMGLLLESVPLAFLAEYVDMAMIYK